jgi:hypothetical protein
VLLVTINVFELDITDGTVELLTIIVVPTG